MIGDLVLLIYPIMWLLAARRVFWSLVNDEYLGLDEHDNGMDRFMFGVLGLLVGAFWPLALPVTLIMAKPRKTEKQYQQEAEDLQQHIRDLERELGIK